MYSVEDDHHCIIFGIYDNELKIKARTYFSGKDAEIKDALKKGVEYKVFNEYLKKLLCFKKKKDGRAGGGSIEPSSYEIVAMVSNNGDVVSCMAFAEYLMEHSQVLNFDQEPTNDQEQYNVPSMGM